MISRDAVTILQINKTSELKACLPIARFTTQQSTESGSWIIFSTSLSSNLFEELDASVGGDTPVIDMWMVGDYDVALMAGDLTAKHKQFLQENCIEYASLLDAPDLSKPGLVVFDMDSTVIQIECIDEIAKLAGVGEEVSKVTEKAMQGELDFEQSLRQRVATLKGADEKILQQVRAQLPLMPELELLIASLKYYGWKVAIASGGFTYFSDHLKDKLKLDFAQSNVLDIENGQLTGKVNGDVVSAQTKADILLALAKQHSIEIENTVAVGDGANDLNMMSVAGLGIAYHAKEKVQQQAQVSIRYSGLGGVFCIMSGLLIKNELKTLT